MEHITTSVLAEVCSTLMLGRESNGKFLWMDQDRRSFYWDTSGYIYDVHSYVPNIRQEFYDEITRLEENVIGYGESSYYAYNDDVVLFTDKSVYISDYGNTFRISYSEIDTVRYEKEVFQIYGRNGAIFSLGSVAKWNKQVRLDILRLFLLVVARIFGECTYQFTSGELAILQSFRLQELRDKSLTEFL